MSSLVKLYVYDLSNGLARQLSLQLTGKQIDGIWHTSIVVFGREIFYGAGISQTKPGQSHHGQPMKIIDMGETTIDEETFNDYLQEMNQVYTADKYHLLDFNCNSFTDDCVGFLLGGSIPSWIKNLPVDFLSTPFGAALRPTIDAMYRRPGPSDGPDSQLPNQPLASSLLQSVAAQASGTSNESSSYLPTPALTPSPTPQPAVATVSGPLQTCSNLQHFRSILSSHRAVSAFFTSRTCGPCRVIEPIFEDLAHGKASNGVAFVKIDLGGMFGNEVGGAYGVKVTPTFIFFLNGQKIEELKGANASDLRSQVNLLIFQAFPPHPHTSQNFPAIRALSFDPILFTQVPALDAVQAKLNSFVDATSLMDPARSAAKDVITNMIVPFLKTRFASKTAQGPPRLSADTSARTCEKWRDVTKVLINNLSINQLFPLLDLWRLGLLESSVSTWCSSTSLTSNPIVDFLNHCASSLTVLNKATFLTILRLLSNVFINVMLARSILSLQLLPSNSSPRQLLTSLLVPSLLHEDTGVRMAAASLTFNIAAFYQKLRVEDVRDGRRGEDNSVEGDGDWEVEMVSAVVEALKNETSSEDVVHRLTGSLAFFLHLSPNYETQLKPLLDVLQVQDILMTKLSGGPDGLGEKGVSKKDVRSLVEEVAGKLCN